MGHFRKKMISIFLTNLCNLNCSYCYVEKKNKETNSIIDLDFCKAGISDYFNNNPKPAVRFFANGEPTLAFDEMKEICSYAIQAAKGRKVLFELQTNGYFNDEKAMWIKKNIDVIYISMDGTPDMHDEFRKTIHGEPSSGKISNNIQYFVNGPVQLGIRTTKEFG